MCIYLPLLTTLSPPLCLAAGQQGIRAGTLAMAANVGALLVDTRVILGALIGWRIVSQVYVPSIEWYSLKTLR